MIFQSFSSCFNRVAQKWLANHLPAIKSPLLPEKRKNPKMSLLFGI